MTRASYLTAAVEKRFDSYIPLGVTCFAIAIVDSEVIKLIDAFGQTGLRPGAGDQCTQLVTVDNLRIGFNRIRYSFRLRQPVISPACDDRIIGGLFRRNSLLPVITLYSTGIPDIVKYREAIVDQSWPDITDGSVVCDRMYSGI